MDHTSECPGYREALALLSGRINYERAATVGYGDREFKLDRMHELLARLDNPHRRLPAIHITGTKGKGSTSAMVASVLTASGLRTGLFSSPHLDRVEERIAIDGQACDSAEFVRLVERLRPVVADMDTAARAVGGHETGPTYFELVTALAWLHFVEQQVDVAVMEVGMGGRLDSTNVCSPAVTVITSISFDHTKQLGNTLAEIAGEKAGIIKPGVPVVSGVVDAEPRDVVRRVACEHGCRLVELGRDFDVAYHPPADARLPHAAPKIDFVSRLPGHTVRNDGLSLGLLGRHQAANAAVALQVIEELRRQQWSISDEAVRRGLAAARLPARVELVARSPAVVIDGAHNVASVEALLATLDESFPVARRTLLFATTRDKDVAGMLARLLPRFDRVVLTRYENNPRGVPVDELWALAQGLAAGEAQAGRASIEPDPAAAWRAVWPAASGDELICVAGSLFIAAEMRRLALASTGVEALRSTAVSAAEEDFLAGNPATRSN